MIGTTEQVIKNHLRSAFDKLGVWSRLELAMVCRELRRKKLTCRFGSSRLLTEPRRGALMLVSGTPLQPKAVRRGQLPQGFPVSTWDFERPRHTCTDEHRDDKRLSSAKGLPLIDLVPNPGAVSY